MGLFSRKLTARSRDPRSQTYAHFSEFVATREGVSAYYEAETSREPSAVVLVAVDGEWTRRKVPDIKAAHKLATELGISLYDVAASGYPPAMRQWNLRHR